jgi:hypothetical protein
MHHIPCASRKGEQELERFQDELLQLRPFEFARTTYCQLEVTWYPFAPITRIHGIFPRQRNTGRRLNTSSKCSYVHFYRLQLSNRLLFSQLTAILTCCRRLESKPGLIIDRCLWCLFQHLNSTPKIGSVVTFIFPKGNSSHHPARRSWPCLIIPFNIYNIAIFISQNLCTTPVANPKLLQRRTSLEHQHCDRFRRCSSLRCNFLPNFVATWTHVNIATSWRIKANIKIRGIS